MTSILRRRPARGLLLAFGALALARCVDVTPVEYSAPDATVDAPTEAGPGAGLLRPECIACLDRFPDGGAPGCGDKKAACYASPACTILYQCTDVRGCLAAPNEVERNNCALPCTTLAGITSFDDPNLLLIYAVVDCSFTCPGCPNGPDF
jgi:hypothetical protein